MNENHNSSGTGINWLGFSLSPQLKMEVSSSSSSTSSPASDSHQNHNYFHQQQPGEHGHHQSSAAAIGMLLSQTPQLTNPSLCFDVGVGGGANPGFVSPPLSVMPLKSDGSLCIMENFTKSQPHQAAVAPKLENYLGGETTGLSLDSLYYHQTTEQEVVNRHHNHQQQQHNFDAYLSLLGGQGLVYQISNQDSLSIDQQINENNNSSENAVFAAGFGDPLQSLSLSMSPGSQSSCVTASTMTTTTATVHESGIVAIETKKRGIDKVYQKQTVHRKSIDTFGQRTSQYRGVTKHRWTGRYEAHLWDNSCKKEGQTRKGRQVYLGGYDMEEKAARAYDLAALKYWGLSTHTNFPIENYKEEIEEMKNMTRQEYVAHLRRKSSGFSRGASMYRGVTRHHQHGRWQARIGRVAGNKDLYLGTFSTQEEAAEAYDVAAIKFRGVNAVTNFDISRYDVEKIMASNALLAGEQAKRAKIEATEEANERCLLADNAGNPISTLANTHANASEWKMMLYNNSQNQQQQQNYGNPSFSLALQDLVGLETANPTQATVDNSAKLGSVHLSNASSLLTTLNPSREGSPERNGNGSYSEQIGPKFVGHAGMVNAWMPSSQLRPAAAAAVAIPVTHLPVFAAWGES